MKKYLVNKIKKYKNILYLFSAIYSFPFFFCQKGKKGNQIDYSGAFLKTSSIQIYGRNNKIIINPENRLKNCKLFIKGNNCEIIVGKHSILNHLELWIEDDSGKINIGCHTTIEGGHIAATEGTKIMIGEDCMFSHRIEIRNGDSHSIFDIKSSKRINNAKDVKIGNHVWLGADTKILKGSIIDDGSVIATGAIVTSHVESNSIYAGVPAKKVKENIYWERER